MPPLERGQRVRGIGLFASCSAVGPASGPDVVTYENEAASRDSPLRPCHVTGTVEWSQLHRYVGSRMVLRVHNFRVFCEPAAVVGPPPSEEVVTAPVVFPPAESRVTVQCTLMVCPEYVLEDLDDEAPDVRSDWLVEEIQIELREQVWQGEPNREWASSGAVMQVLDLDQAQWSDEPEGFNGMYRLDLRPVNS